MSLKSSNKVATNRYQLEVGVDATIFEKALEQAYRRENKKISIPGFRKGKAPRAFVEKYYGEQVFYEDAINAVYPDALEQAIKEAQLEMVEDKIDFDLVSAGKDGVVFKATITTKPEVEIDNYKGIAVTKKPVVVTDEDIDAEIKKVQERNSRMITVEDREAQNGDIVVIDFDGYVDGVAFDGGKADNYSLTLGSGQFIPGFEEQVVGHKTGDEFDVNVKFPEDYHAENLAGKDAVFKIKLHEIKMKELPEVDDDFVKDVSDFDTLDKYKEDIRKRLTDAKERSAKDDVENQLIDKLVENVKAEIPQAMYENRINEDIREFSYRLQSQGLNLETYLKYTGMDKDAFRKQFLPQAERQVKVRLALEQIAKLENIHPTDEEIEEEFAKLAKSYDIDAEKVKAFIPKEELVKDIAVQKAIDLVRDSAIISEGTEKAE
ncbi:trigger factor [Caproiciproducens galactitolivorans]|uniref:Trigger factor n=1 Tax=Caproiciproducens galactitolivorans TaxID=642589 RepID=A0A4Z0YBB9_9FIRM|nr:trigger factor [Caproiciproducens galactitolivorans]QEY34056.1 trigger factor [Caproiciproducens galactitolivorans]TGJ76531.1 trigger factor [Caproiciproducens galactitolivorans]